MFLEVDHDVEVVNLRWRWPSPESIDFPKESQLFVSGFAKNGEKGTYQRWLFINRWDIFDTAEFVFKALRELCFVLTVFIIV